MAMSGESSIAEFEEKHNFRLAENQKLAVMDALKGGVLVITGGPGTGKSSIVHSLEKSGFPCIHEISREVILEAQKQGIEQLFLEDPLLFSRKLLEARKKQHEDTASFKEPVFLDRGIPDVLAYLKYLGTPSPELFSEACENYKYRQVFILPPWKEIYLNDNERYESFEQAESIFQHLKNTYLSFGYQLLEVPKISVEGRKDFILNNLEM